MLTIGNIYRRNETLTRDPGLKLMITLSPTLAPIGLITWTSISLPPPSVEQAVFEVHDSHAPVFFVFTRAVVEWSSVTIPSSVAKILVLKNSFVLTSKFIKIGMKCQYKRSDNKLNLNP